MWQVSARIGDTENQEDDETLQLAWSRSCGVTAIYYLDLLWMLRRLGNRECAVFRDLDLLGAREEEATQL